MTLAPINRAWAGAALWIALILPPVRHVLESTMTLQMLVQIPLLVVAGWLMARVIPAKLETVLARWNAGGVPGLLLATFVATIWMLPRMMDAAIDDGGFALAKFISVTLLIGMPVALSWPRAGFVVAGVFMLELIATAFRLGWLYLVTPERLCSNYLLGDQQRLGQWLLVIGIAICFVLTWRLMWGRVRV